MMGFDEFSNTGLLLGLGLTLPSNKRADLNHNHNPQKPNKPAVGASLFCFAAAETEPGLTLGLSTAAAEPAQSAVSCLTGGGRVKREREVSGEDVEEEKGSCRVSDEDEEGSNCRKKLRLTKQQSALLEDSFKLHTTLNPKEKQVLARELNLRARQVEVWFQNRRARTKSKQTEVDCEFLKRCCETLTDENRRLQKELQELKALKLAHPLFMQMPAATLSICPSCERIGGGAATANGETKPNAPFKPLFYKPFTNPSAAC